MYDNSACSVADGCTRCPTREATASGSVALSMCMNGVWNTCSSVSKVDVPWLSALKMNTIEISWSVKGYHYFKVKPNPGEVIQVRVDPNAMSRHAVVHLTVSHYHDYDLRVYRTVYGIPDKVRFMSITDEVRYIRITDQVRYTCNTDFVYIII